MNMLNIIVNLLIMALMILIPTLMCILIAKKPVVAVGLLVFMIMYYLADDFRKTNFGDLSTASIVDVEGDINVK